MKKEISKGKIGNTLLMVINLLSVICIAGGFTSMLVSLLTRSKSNFTGTEVYYDKINLLLFNTIVLNGVIVLIITFFLYNAFTKWKVRNYPFMIIELILIFIIFCIGYLRIGFAISGMASISDATFQMGEMTTEYINFWNQAVVSLWINIGLIIIALAVAVYKPFGRREREAAKRGKQILIVEGIVLAIVVGMFIRSEITLFSTRNLPIKDINVQNIEDGEYEGQSVYGNNAINVVVTVENHKIVKVEDPNPNNSVFTKYASGVFNKIKAKQTPDVDAITGATTTSKAYMKAVEDALTKK